MGIRSNAPPGHRVGSVKERGGPVRPEPGRTRLEPAGGDQNVQPKPMKGPARLKSNMLLRSPVIL